MKRIRNRHGLKTDLIALIVFLVGCLVSCVIVWDVYSTQSVQKHSLVQSIANSRSHLFLQALEERTSVSNTIEALVFDDGGEKKDLDGISEEIYRDTHPMISYFGIAPQGVMSYVYPESEERYEGEDLFTSDDAIGLNYARESQRNYIVVKDDQLEIYNPVYLREKNTGYQEFWGFAMVSGPLKSILKDARIRELDRNGYYYSLKVESSYNHSEKTLASNHDMDHVKHMEVYTSEEPGYTFTLSIVPKNGWCDKVVIAMTVGLCVALTILITLLTLSLLRQRHSNELLSRISSTDRLTGLPNSRSFGTTTDLLRREERFFTLFFLDANDFKHVNDTYGHEAGNEVLCEYGIRLQEIFPDQVYRLGGDEFAAIMPEALSEEEAGTYIHRINDVLNRPYELNDQKIVLSMSVGWAVSRDTEDNDVLLNQADQMMYRNKQNYHQKMHETR